MPKAFRSLTVQILLAIGLGLILGLLFGPKVSFLGAVGGFFIQLIKTIAVPLIFFAIIDSILTSEIRWRSAKHLFVVIFVNTFCAATIGLLLANIFKPGKYLNIASVGVSGDIAERFKSLQGKDLFGSFKHAFPDNLIDPFQKNSVIAVVLLALVIGFAAKAIRVKANDNFNVLVQFIDIALKIFEQILRWIIKIIPLAILGVVARTVGEYGLSPLHGLVIYVAVGLLGLTLQIVIVYQAWLVFFVKMPLSMFWRGVREAVIHAIGSNSSLATLPLTLKALEELKISKSASRLGACVATNLNNDGILLYEALAVLIVAQASGIDLSLWQQIVIAGLSVLAAIGITGVPEAGLVSLALVLTTVGFSLDLLPVLLTVDWILARGRSVVNVLSDIMVSIVVDQFEKKEI